MKKRKGLYLAVLMMLFTMVFGMSSMAATKVVTLKNNRLTGVSVKDYDDVVYYKLSVNQTGYLAVYGYKQYSYSSAGEKNGLFSSAIPESSHWRKSTILTFTSQITGKIIMG